MRMFSTLFLSTFTLAGCATIPANLYETPVPADQIIVAVTCELASIYHHSDVSADLLRYSSSLTKLDLIVTDDSGVNPGLGLEKKVGETTVTLQPKGKLADKAIRTSKVQFGTALADLSPTKPVGASLQETCPFSDSGSNGLGLADWLHQVLLSAGATAAQFENVSFIADFTVTRSAGGGLVFKSTYGSLSFNETQLSHQRQNKIEVTIKVEKPPQQKGVSRILDKTIEELRRLQEPEDEGTTIKVDPGQTIIIQ